MARLEMVLVITIAMLWTLSACGEKNAGTPPPSKESPVAGEPAGKPGGSETGTEEKPGGNEGTPKATPESAAEPEPAAPAEVKALEEDEPAKPIIGMVYTRDESGGDLAIDGLSLLMNKVELDVAHLSDHEDVKAKVVQYEKELKMHPRLVDDYQVKLFIGDESQEDLPVIVEVKIGEDEFTKYSEYDALRVKVTETWRVYAPADEGNAKTWTLSYVLNAGNYLRLGKTEAKEKAEEVFLATVPESRARILPEVKAQINRILTAP